MRSLATKLARHGFRLLGKSTSALGSYAILPLDHRQVLVPPEADGVYGPVQARIAENDALYADLLARLTEPIARVMEPLDVDPPDAARPQLRNAYFQGNDARIACGLTALLRPSRIIEIGSGNSTKFFRHALTATGNRARISCIDPAPRTEILAVADDIQYQRVQDVDLSMFRELQAGDILFCDGSHLVVRGADTQYIALEILPLLAKGVVVHFHDINLPYEYRDFYARWQYGEQYLLATLLLFSREWQTLLPVYWLEQTGRLAQVDHPAASFWFTNDLAAVTTRLLPEAGQTAATQEPALVAAQ